MPRGYEIDQDYSPVITDAQVGERLAQLVARQREMLAVSNSEVDLNVIRRRLRAYGHEAVEIAIRTAHEKNLVEVDLVDGIVYPPRSHAPVDRMRYM